MVAFFVIQRLLRRSDSAKSFRGGPYDRGNMMVVGSATGIGLWLPLVFDFLAVAIFPIRLVEGLVALVVMVLGVVLRAWAAVTLGRYYTTTLMTMEGQKVVTTGPYARVRHPGYLGEVLLWSGFGVLSGNLIVMFLLPVMFVAVYLYRISVEERMLRQVLGDDYVKYSRRTKRLVPFLY